MEEDTEFLKLSVEERCVHKLWKARLSGYEEAAKLFRQIDDEKSPEFAKYLGLVKKFVIDNNAVAQEKGLEAVLAFVENYSLAGKSVGEVMSGIVAKCIAAPKTKTKELAVQVVLMYVEAEKFEAVQEELMKGMDAKNPKIVTACISAVTLALREFGPKVISIKPLIKKMATLLEGRDQSVREEGKAMVVEMYRWIGASLQSQLSSLKPVQVTELEAEFSKLKGEKAMPTRYLRSQKQKQAKIAAEVEAAGGDMEGEDEDEGDGPVADLDPYELMEPVDILSKLPKDFYEKVEAKKWQDRKEAVDTLEQLLAAPKLESGDYGDLVRALKKIISKDLNVMVVAVAGKCLALLARGLKKRFQPYAGVCVPTCLEKFREKKQNVVLALRDAIDAVYLATTIEAIHEDVLAALDNKNPQVKAETASFVARCFTRCTPAMLNKKLLKAYTTALLKTLNEPDPGVRELAAEALGTAMKVVGEKAIMAFMTDVDNLKLAKIKECSEKAVLLVKTPKERTTVSKPTRTGDAGGGTTAPKPVTRRAPGSGLGPKKPATKKPPASLCNVASGVTNARSKVVEREMSSEEVDERAAELLPNDAISGLGDGNWKARLAAVEQFVQVVNSMDPSDVPAQVLIRTLNKKPGLKDTNFQVLKARLEALKLIAELCTLSTVVTDHCLVDVADKLGDPKNGALAGEVLTAVAASTKLDFVVMEVLSFAFNQKSPKVQQEALNWTGNAIREFGFVVQPKPVVEHIKRAIAATHPGVRTAGMSLAGTLYLYMGQQLCQHFDTEKPAVQQQIYAEFDKRSGERPPTPTRGKAPSTAKVKEIEEPEEEEEETQEMPETRVDIGPQLTEALLEEMSHKDWKVRNEALTKLSTMVSDSKLITSNLGDLPPVLMKRLGDSNSKIAATAMSVCQQLGMAMGPQGKTHVRTLFPGWVQGMGDSKSWVRMAAIACIDTWGERCGYKEFFVGEMMYDALKAGSPTLRAELWTWLANKLVIIPVRSIPKEELLICLPLLYSNLEDRNADVRKNSQEAVLGVMTHLGYDSMFRAVEKLSASSRTIILAYLEKVRGNLPVKPVARKAAAANEEQDRTSTKNAASRPATKGKVGGATSKPGNRPKKDEDVDFSPLLQNNKLKFQRSMDEQKLKVLKWSFTAPRDEFVELLKDQMAVANVNKSLTSNMFHSDFKFHLKAIDALGEDLPGNIGATVANLDLILKWMTLRFFDTNPSVLLKGLEYLQTVFAVLIEEQYVMTDTEASSFLPYLILKIGDSKDAVRNGVRVLLKQLERIYPATKVFSYMMEGLKSKNARQRTECLDVLGMLIADYNVVVCTPNPNTALREIARQISDRDNSVRNAALNTIVQAYYLEGERVYKMVGQISDKDMSLLEERIKRASRNPNRPGPRPPGVLSKAPLAPSRVQALQPLQQVLPIQQQRLVNQEPEGAVGGDDQCEELVDQPPPLRASPPKPRPVSGPFGLDMDLLQRIEGNGNHLPEMQLNEFDLQFLHAPSVGVAGMGKRSVTSSSPSLTSPLQLLDRAITDLASPDPEHLFEAAVQLEYLLHSDQAKYMAPKLDDLVRAVVTQFRQLKASPSSNSPTVCKSYRSLLMLLTALYEQPQLPQKISRPVLRSHLEQLVMMLVDQRLESLVGNESFIRVINTTVLRILVKADHTTVTCVLIEVLHDCVGEGNSLPKFTELVTKCLWRVIKLIPNWEPGLLQVDMVLLQTHLFLKAYPTSMWKKLESDTPVRTIKTTLHTLTKVLGPRILHHLGRIDCPEESEQLAYLHKLIKSVAQEEQKVTSAKKDGRLQSQPRFSKNTHELLSEIFKNIGSKDKTKEGLAQLYDFREQHPEADIEPFLKKSSQFFQEYIQRGLQAINVDRRRQAESSQKPMMTSGSSVSSLGTLDTTVVLTPSSEDGNPKSLIQSGEDNPNVKDPYYFLERLRTLQMSAGIAPTQVLRPQDSGRPNDNPTRDENLNGNVKSEENVAYHKK